MKYLKLIVLNLLIALTTITSKAQDSSFVSTDMSVSKQIDGTLLEPLAKEKRPLAIIIAGSGPTDRNGNQNMLKNNSLKKLAEGITKNNIATFRYDKRVVKQIRDKKIDPNTTFDDFITDAESVLSHFKSKDQFSKIYIIGHSQGSLVGMVAAKKGADGFISLAGAGQSIDEVIINQIGAMDPSLIAETKKAFTTLKSDGSVSDYPVALGSIFRTDIQPFILNWMQYKPTEIIKFLDIPILIVNGTKDLQVSEREAELLKEAAENAELQIIKNMNHVLFMIEGDTLENSKSYNESARPISEELLKVVSEFILKD